MAKNENLRDDMLRDARELAEQGVDREEAFRQLHGKYYQDIVDTGREFQSQVDAVVRGIVNTAYTESEQ